MPHAFASVSWLLMNQLYMCCLGVCRLECIPMWPGKNTLIYFNETTRPLRVHGTHSLVRPINPATASHLNSMHSLPCSQCLSANPAIRLSTDRQTERPEVWGGGGGRILRIKVSNVSLWWCLSDHDGSTVGSIFLSPFVSIVIFS